MDYFYRAENGVLGNALKDGMFSWVSLVFGEILNPTYVQLSQFSLWWNFKSKILYAYKK